MNLLFFLTPKQDVLYIYEDFTLRQTLEKWANQRFATIPVLKRNGEYVGTITEGDILWGIKNLHGLDLEASEDVPISSFPRRRDYKAVTVTTDMPSLLQAAIDQFMSSYATDTQITDRAVENGDTVNLTYTGSIDGQVFEGGSAENQDYTAGSDELIDDFLTQIIGAMPGDTVKVQVTFPDPYTPNTDLSGKQAVFDTTINYIHGDAQPPELTEDFVTNYLSYYYGYTSVEDMRQKISAQLLEEQKYNYVLDWLYDNCTFQPVPEQLVQDQLTILDTELANAANGYGITLDELAAKYGADSVDALKEAHRPQLENMIRQNLMCQALAQDAGITVDQDAVDEYFAQQGVNDCTALMKSYGKGYIYQGVRTELVAQYLMEHVAAE